MGIFGQHTGRRLAVFVAYRHQGLFDAGGEDPQVLKVLHLSAEGVHVQDYRGQSLLPVYDVVDLV